MNELINQICAIDEQVRKNRQYMEYVYAVGVRQMSTPEMRERAIKLGPITMELLKQRVMLADKLYNEYGIIYLIETR